MARVNPKFVGSKGLAKLKTNLAQEKVLRKAELDRGLAKGALHLQRESQKRVPVDTGNLKASAFTRREAGADPSYLIGYTSAYALFVHEAVGMKLKGQKRTGKGKGHYWDPQGQAGPKFLEAPAREERSTIRGIVVSEMKGSIL